jgi:hypothetical protein
MLACCGSFQPTSPNVPAGNYFHHRPMLADIYRQVYPAIRYSGMLPKLHIRRDLQELKDVEDSKPCVGAPRLEAANALPL